MIIQPQITNLTNDIKYLIASSQEKAIRAIDFERVILYWSIGKRIFEEIQGGEARAEYGKSLIKNLSNELEPLYGSGYGIRQLELMSQDEASRIKNLLDSYDIPTTYPIKDVEDFYNHFFLDKKSLDDKIKFIVPVGIGDCKITELISKSDVIEVLKGFVQCNL